MLEETEVSDGSRRASILWDSSEGSREENILGSTQGEARKSSDSSGISNGEISLEKTHGGRGEGGWSWLVVLAG